MTSIADKAQAISKMLKFFELEYVNDNINNNTTKSEPVITMTQVQNVISLLKCFVNDDIVMSMISSASNQDIHLVCIYMNLNTCDITQRLAYIGLIISSIAISGPYINKVQLYKTVCFATTPELKKHCKSLTGDVKQIIDLLVNQIQYNKYSLSHVKQIHYYYDKYGNTLY